MKGGIVFTEQDCRIPVEFGSVETRTLIERDYEKLTNKPFVNGTELIGNVSLDALGLRAIYYDSKAHWDAMEELISEEGALYVYKDYELVYFESDVPTPAPAIKIGDGVSLLKDLPVLAGSSSTPAITDYLQLENRPSINGVTLEGDMQSEDFGILSVPMDGEDQEGGILTRDGEGGLTWVTVADSPSEGDNRPITAGAVYAEIGNINILLDHI